MSERTNWIVVVADTITKKWPPAKALTEVGVPLKLAARYQRIRYDMTTGLKRRLAKELRN